jgi:hypothetical protein
VIKEQTRIFLLSIRTGGILEKKKEEKIRKKGKKKKKKRRKKERRAQSPFLFLDSGRARDSTLPQQPKKKK